MRMKKTADRLRQLMEERNLRQVDILRLAAPYCREYNLKLTKSDMSQFLSGKVEPGQWKLTIIGKALNVSEAWLMGYDVPRERDHVSLPGNIVPISMVQSHKIPIIGSVAAGEPIWDEDSYDVYVDGPAKADFAMKVEGDSMEPTYYNGDVIYVRSQSAVDNGRVAVVILDSTAALKHVYRGKTALTLISDNPKYEPMVLPYDDYETVRIIGVPVGYTRMFNGHNKP